jgi:hypothetical protein
MTNDVIRVQVYTRRPVCGLIESILDYSSTASAVLARLRVCPYPARRENMREKATVAIASGSRRAQTDPPAGFSFIRGVLLINRKFLLVYYFIQIVQYWYYHRTRPGQPAPERDHPHHG